MPCPSLYSTGDIQVPPPAPRTRAGSSPPTLVLLSVVHGLKNPHSQTRIIIILFQSSLLVETPIAAYNHSRSGGIKAPWVRLRRV